MGNKNDFTQKFSAYVEIQKDFMGSKYEYVSREVYESAKLLHAKEK